MPPDSLLRSGSPGRTLGLERVSVVHPGAKRYRLADRVEAVPLHALGKGESIFAGAAS